MLLIGISIELWKITCISSFCSIDKLSFESFSIFSFLHYLLTFSSVSQIIKDLCSSYSFHCRGIILHQRKIPRQNRELNPGSLIEYITTLLQSQASDEGKNYESEKKSNSGLGSCDSVTLDSRYHDTTDFWHERVELMWQQIDVQTRQISVLFIRTVLTSTYKSVFHVLYSAEQLEYLIYMT